jgi:adenylate kinase family enzyme
VGKNQRIVDISAKKKLAVLWVSRIHGGKDTHLGPHENLGYSVFNTGDQLKARARLEPNNKNYDPIRQRQLVKSDLVIWIAKVWILRHKTMPIIHLNGVPRNIEQLHGLHDYIVARGFYPMVVWFTTPEKVCMERPSRPGREEEDAPEKRQRMMDQYRLETEPMLQVMRDRYNINENYGNLILIDNSDKSKTETSSLIFNFLGLPDQSWQFFPKKAEELAQKRNKQLAVA